MTAPQAPTRTHGGGPAAPTGGGAPWWSRSPGLVLLPLRLFLGVTFTYAGLQKIANPAFFRSSSPISIHAQLVGARYTSPIGGVAGGLAHVAPVVGWVIALGEVAIGLGTLVGLWTRVAAIAGMALSFGLFLTVSFHSSPYFTGADIVFFFAWTPFALAGAAGAPAIDTWAAREVAAAEAAPPGPPEATPRPGAVPPGAVPRRAVVARGAATALLAAVGLIGSGVVAWVGRAVGGSPTRAGDAPRRGRPGPGSSAPPTTGTTAPKASSATGPSTTTPPTTTSPKEPAGHRLTSAARVPEGGSLAFVDPETGDPGLVIHERTGRFVAFNAICPHAGCTVGYAPSANVIACPCHGSEFNPETGALVRGPANRGLTKISLAVGADGELYVDG